MTEADDFIKRICAALHDGSFRGLDDEGTRVYELPLGYLDGEPLEIHVTADGDRIDDGGRTLLRLLGRRRLQDVDRWELWEQYARLHRIRREEIKLVYAGSSRSDILAYFQGLRDLEFVMPETKESGGRFDHAIREAVREAIEAEVARGTLDEERAEEMLKPTYTVRLRKPRVTIDVKADFANRDLTRYYIILSHASDSASGRGGHINARLAEHLLGREHAGKEVRAIVPFDHYFEPDEEARIVAFTGHQPVRVSSLDPRPLIRRVLETDHGPLDDHRSDE